MYRADGPRSGRNGNPRTSTHATDDRARPLPHRGRRRRRGRHRGIVRPRDDRPWRCDLPTGGVTWVSCPVTTIARAAPFADAGHPRRHRPRDEPLAALGASEGGIYERFAYGVASVRRGSKSIDDGPNSAPRTTEAGSSARPPRRGSGAVHAALGPGAPPRPGEVDRNEAWMRMLVTKSPPPPRSLCTTTDSRCGRPSRNGTWGIRPTRCGRTIWRRRRRRPTPRCGTRCCRLDLTGPIRRSSCRSTNRWRSAHRSAALAPGGQNGPWLNLRDIKRCFEARTYGTDDDIVVRPMASVGGSAPADARRYAIERTSIPTTRRSRR